MGRIDFDENSIVLTPDQIKALAHATDSDESIAASMMAAEDMELPKPGSMGFTIEAFITSDGEDPGGVLVGYPWNKDGMPTWLNSDGGWHFQPGEKGYYPWRDGDDS